MGVLPFCSYSCITWIFRNYLDLMELELLIIRSVALSCDQTDSGWFVISQQGWFTTYGVTGKALRMPWYDGFTWSKEIEMLELFACFLYGWLIAFRWSNPIRFSFRASFNGRLPFWTVLASFNKGGEGSTSVVILCDLSGKIFISVSKHDIKS